jgi:[protein-PII] uridylyltransferase
MGFAEADVATLAAMVRHHLLLPDTATRRDIDDPATIDRGGRDHRLDPALLQLLHALAQADGAATSSSAWSPWKAHLVAALVARVQARLGGAPAPEPEPVLHPGQPQVSREAPADAAGGISVGVEDVADGQQVTIVGPDRHGLFSQLAGVLALNQLDVRAAKVNVVGDRATAVFAVGRGSGGHGRLRSWPSGAGGPRGDAARGRAAPAAGGRLPAGRPSGRTPRVSWHNGEVTATRRRNVDRSRARYRIF